MAFGTKVDICHICGWSLGSHSSSLEPLGGVLGKISRDVQRIRLEERPQGACYHQDRGLGLWAGTPSFGARQSSDE